MCSQIWFYISLLAFGTSSLHCGGSSKTSKTGTGASSCSDAKFCDQIFDGINNTYLRKKAKIVEVRERDDWKENTSLQTQCTNIWS
jgi:hypothetical protein